MGLERSLHPGPRDLTAPRVKRCPTRGALMGTQKALSKCRLHGGVEGSPRQDRCGQERAWGGSWAAHNPQRGWPEAAGRGGLVSSSCTG